MPKAPYRSKQPTQRSPTRERRTARRATQAHIEMLMSDNTGVQPVAVAAVTARITATLSLLVTRDITHSIRPGLHPTQVGAGLMASGAQKTAAPDSEQQLAGMKAPTIAFRPDSAGADSNPRSSRHATFTKK